MKPHNCKKPFLCSCEVEKLSEKTSDKMMEVVKGHFKQKGEQMTVKEEIRKRISRITVDHKLTKDERNEFIEIAMSEYTLNIVKQAVSKEIENANTWTEEACANRILSRIKKLIKEK